MARATSSRFSGLPSGVARAAMAPRLLFRHDPPLRGAPIEKLIRRARAITKKGGTAMSTAPPVLRNQELRLSGAPPLLPERQSGQARDEEKN
jgi:hypothetical protein